MSPSVTKIPAELLYWGHLPAGTTSGDALRFRFERFLPIPIEQLHSAQVAIANGGFLIVGIEPDRLRAYLATRTDITPATWELVPDRLPEHVAEIPGAAQRLSTLNLLHGDFEPAPSRRLRTIMAFAIHLGLAMTVLLVVIGVERRVQLARDHAVAQRLATRAALALVIPDAPGGVKPELRLTMEVRRLEQAARDPAATSGDLAHLIQALWRVWPTTLRAQVDTVSANPERIVIRGRTAGLAQAEQLAQACAQVISDDVRYRAEPLQAQGDERGASFLLTLVRQDAGGRP